MRPRYRRVDSCAGEVEAGLELLLLDLGRGRREPPRRGGSVVILGSGPNRIGQGIEFDYCCVHAAQSFRALGYEAVMVNCNPETVSTDYDTSDRLYFEPLRVEEVLAICERERPEGVVIQFGGQTPLKLARRDRGGGLPDPRDAVRGGRPGRGPRALRRALRRARDRGAGVGDGDLARRGGRGRRRGSATPCSCGPSYVLGGRSMRVCYDEADVREAAARGGHLLVDRFLENAIELDVDALCDGTRHLRRRRHAARRGGRRALRRLELRPARAAATRPSTSSWSSVVSRLGPALGVVGLLNVQLAIADGRLYVLEANPRASRTVPFVSKATGVNLVQAACRLAAGAKLPSSALAREDSPWDRSRVKAAVLPFARFPGADPVLGPEMRSTGEVMASASDLPTAFAEAERAAGRRLPAERDGVPLRARRGQGVGRPRRPQRSRRSASSCSRRPARPARSPPPAWPSSTCAR